MVFLLHGEDSFRTRLRLGELVAALLSGAPTGATDLSTLAEPHLGTLLGVTRHDARLDTPGAIMLSGQAQGLFDVLDEPRVVIVDHAEALGELDLIASFPREAALVLVSVERLPAGRARRSGQRAKAPNAPATNLLEAVEDWDRLARACTESSSSQTRWARSPRPWAVTRSASSRR